MYGYELIELDSLVDEYVSTRRIFGGEINVNAQLNFIEGLERWFKRRAKHAHNDSRHIGAGVSSSATGSGTAATERP